MVSYCLAGGSISFPGQIVELSSFSHQFIRCDVLLPLLSPNQLTMFARTVNWMEGEERALEAWQAPSGVVLKTSGGADFYIAPGGASIARMKNTTVQGERDSSSQYLSELDRAILLGPALILSLAMRSVWTLHASAAQFGERVFVFLGESGYGKSTLATYLSVAGWQHVADDLLPVSDGSDGIVAWPHFPQLKLTPDEQPGANLPESLPLEKICLLTPTTSENDPRLEKLGSGDATKAVLRHTAGTRIFAPSMLEKHLEFSAQVGEQIPVYRLLYPHRRETLPLVMKLLEKID